MFYLTKKPQTSSEVYLVEASELARGAKPRPPSIGKRQSRSHRPPQWNRQGRWLIVLNKKPQTSSEVYLVEASGLEPPTPTLSGWCSNLLSYASIWLSVRTTLEYIVVL